MNAFSSRRRIPVIDAPEPPVPVRHHHIEAFVNLQKASARHARAEQAACFTPHPLGIDPTPLIDAHRDALAALCEAARAFVAAEAIEIAAEVERAEEWQRGDEIGEAMCNERWRPGDVQS